MHFISYPHILMPSSSSSSRLPQISGPSTACTGCGARSDVCLTCVSTLQEREFLQYKAQVATGVEKLFLQSTHRAASSLAGVHLKWLFGAWKGWTARQDERRHRILANFVTKTRLRSFYRWRQLGFQRQTLSAMILAEHSEFVHAAGVSDHKLLQGQLLEQRRAEAVLRQRVTGT